LEEIVNNFEGNFFCVDAKLVWKILLDRSGET
jgi:hypothetical protein